MASAAHVTEKPRCHENQHQQQQQQQLLKCPRCDSANTKFCYYNNYNLSQPRHFCKACKRYWTRGGTLRNVPVGGGCRKNKRIKRTFTSDVTHAAATSVTVSHNPNPNHDHVPSSTPLNNINPLYGLLQQTPNHPIFDTRVFNIGDTDVSRNDLLYPPLGLGFSSSDPGATVVPNHAHNSMSLVSSYPSMYNGVPTSSRTSDPTMASVLASSLQQQPRFLGFARYGDRVDSLVNHVQMEGTKSRMDWNNSFNRQNDNEQIKATESSDPSSLLWTAAGGDGGEWLDPMSNIGSSVHSLI